MDPVPARLPHDGAGHGAAGRGVHALRLRRAADPGPGRAHHRGPRGPTSRSSSRPSSSSGRPPTGSTATALSTKDSTAADGHPLHRRQRRPAGQGDPRGRRADDRRPVHRLHLDPLLAAAGRRRRPAASSPRSSSAASTRRCYQRFKVKPSEKSLEQVYIDRNIKATRAAYGIENVKTDALHGDDRGEPGPAARRRRDDPRHPPGRPHRGLPDVQAAPVGQVLLRLPRRPRRRPLHRRRQGPRHRGGRPRARPRRHPGQPAQLAQRPHRLHPRLRRRGGLRQPAHRRRRAGLLRAEHPASRATLGEFEPRVYFGEQSPAYSIVGGATGAIAARVRLPGQQRRRTEEQHLHRQGWRARSARSRASSPTR